ncbi:MAG: alpha-ribazole phosphatase family protein [Bacteroidales bacterium]
MELILIRHTAVDVPKGVCYGQTDVGLQPTFETEAHQVNTQLQTLLSEEEYPVFCSPLSRCRRLASFCGYEDPIIEERVLEMNFGDWEMHVFEEISDEHLRTWFNNWIEETPTNGESFLTMIARVGEFITELKNQGHKRAVVFTHGGVIACARIHAGITTPEKAFENPAGYGEIVRIRF